MGKRRKRKSRTDKEATRSQDAAVAETARSFPPAPPPRRSRWQLALSTGLLALWLAALVVLVVLANR